MSETDQTLLHSGTIFRPGWLANKLDGLIAVQRGRKTTFGADSPQNQKLNLNAWKRGERSAALGAEKLPGALSPWFCRGRWAPFIFLCLLGFPGPNHLRMARLVHGNLPLSFSVLLLRRSAHSGRMVGKSELGPRSRNPNFRLLVIRPQSRIGPWQISGKYNSASSAACTGILFVMRGGRRQNPIRADQLRRATGLSMFGLLDYRWPHSRVHSPRAERMTEHP